MNDEILKFHAIRIVSKNDVNGNPQRGWIITTLERFIEPGFIDEGYEGDRVLKLFTKRGFLIPDIIQINVTPAEYKRIKKQYQPITERSWLLT